MTQDYALTKLESRMDDIEQTLSEIKKCFADIKNIQSKSDCGGYEVHELTNDEKKIKDIMENFDFERVHKVMTLLKWTWLGTAGTPTIPELKVEAHRLLDEAVKEKTCISTGGFRAVYEADGEDDSDPYIGLEFIVADMEGFASDD